MKINLDTGKIKKRESERDKLLREGRLELRREIEARFHARTAAWRESHHLPVGPGEVRVAPPQDNLKAV